MGKVITFYSYKGGVGRTMALANVAVLLSKWEYNVLIIDWDLEAPGLEFFFKDYLDLKIVSQQEGVIDILSRALEDISHPSTLINWTDSIVRIDIPDSKGSLHFLAAGKRNEQYFSKVRGLDLKAFYEHRGGFL